MRRGNITYVIVLTLLVGLSIIWFIPVIWMIGTAFKPQSDIFEVPPRIWPKRLVIDNVIVISTQWPVGQWFLNSFVVALGTTMLSLFLSIFAAYAFARLRWPGRDLLFVCLLIFMFVPWQINIVPLFFLASNLKLLNTLPGVILPMAGMPIGVFLLRQFFLNIPGEIEDAARVDGCGRLGILFRIIIPMSGPVLAAYSLYIFNYAWNEFLWSLICLQRRQVMTLTIGLKLIQGAYTRDYGLVMAGAFLGALPSFLMFILARRWMIRAFVMASSVGKG